MSPSWISRRFKSGARPKASLGIALGRREICAVHTVFGEKGAQVQHIDSTQLSEELFTGRPTASIETNLAAAFAQVTKAAKDKFMPCHVALPDPMARLAVFELDELPKSEKTRSELVRWRFAKESSGTDQTLDCVYQELGQENGKQLLLGQAMDNAWLQCVKQALRKAGVTPWSLNQGACYRFNQFHDRFAKEKHGAAMVVLDPDSWSVLLWDAAARPLLVRSRWRSETGGTAQDHDAIALEVERSILSYVRSGKGNSVTRVYAVSHARELEKLATALDRRLREKCVPLTTSTANPEKDGKIEDHGLASLSLAAAVA